MMLATASGGGLQGPPAWARQSWTGWPVGPASATPVRPALPLKVVQPAVAVPAAGERSARRYPGRGHAGCRRTAAGR